MKERILKLAADVIPQVDLTSSDALVDDGILDSLGVAALLVAISEEFGVEIDINELTSDNLNSIDAIVETVQNLKK